jgi:hypothetical protein
MICRFDDQQVVGKSQFREPCVVMLGRRAEGIVPVEPLQGRE